jgi:hypothetical protein
MPSGGEVEIAMRVDALLFVVALAVRAFLAFRTAFPSFREEVVATRELITISQ